MAEALNHQKSEVRGQSERSELQIRAEISIDWQRTRSSEFKLQFVLSAEAI